MAKGRMGEYLPDVPGRGRGTMYCLRCGDCCRRMAPSGINPCPLLEFEGDVAKCTDYENRPEECKDHNFLSTFCPIGLAVLKITQEEAIKRLRMIYCPECREGGGE